MGLPLMNDLAEIGTVLQHQVERAAREWLAANRAAGSTRPRLAFNAVSVELLLQQPDRAEFGITAEDRPHDLRLAVDDEEFAFSTRYPSGGTPPIHIPFRFEAAILSRMRSPMTSRSNWANDKSTLSVRRPIDVVVLNCCVTDTKEVLL